MVYMESIWGLSPTAEIATPQSQAQPKAQAHCRDGCVALQVQKFAHINSHSQFSALMGKCISALLTNRHFLVVKHALEIQIS